MFISKDARPRSAVTQLNTSNAYSIIKTSSISSKHCPDVTFVSNEDNKVREGLPKGGRSLM